jgi:hypothetical protein
MAKPVNKYDGVQIKHMLDDAVGAVSKKNCTSASDNIQYFDKKGHDEDNRVSDLRLGLGLACCFFAGLAQFYPAPYPDNKIILAICVVSYLFSLSVTTFLLHLTISQVWRL